VSGRTTPAGWMSAALLLLGASWVARRRLGRPSRETT
jgi:hypothetical protein